MLTVREVMQKLSYEHPDAPVVVRIEKLHYGPDEDNPEGPDVLIPEETEVESVAVSAVTRHTDGRVEIE